MYLDDIIGRRAEVRKVRAHEWQMTLRRRINSMEFAMSTCVPVNRHLYEETRRICFESLIKSQLEGVILERQLEQYNRLSEMNSGIR